MSSRMKDIRTMENVEKVIRLGSWLLKEDRHTYLEYYADIRHADRREDRLKREHSEGKQ